MLTYYWSVAWRSLVRNKIYSLINVLGLALGVCACLVIYLITRYECSFDTFHPDRNRIYCVDAVMGGHHMNLVPTPMPAAIREQITGLETVAPFQYWQASVAIPGSDRENPRRFDDAGRIAITESSYFDIFQYQWLSGNAATSLNRPNSVVLTAEKAREYFGELAPDKIIGRTFYYEDSLMVTVTGVVADWTGNSDFKCSQWISYATIPVSFLKNMIQLERWDMLSKASQVMIKLPKEVKPAQIDAQLTAFAKRQFGQHTNFSFRLKPMAGIHFSRDYGGEGRKASLPVLYTLMAAAGFILLLAIVNFVNLSTAQSMQRAREVGVRKVLGGGKSTITVQFFTETLVLTVAAVILAALMVKPVFGLFADLMPDGIHFRLDGATLLFLLLVTAATALLAGFYPAKVLGRYLPTVVLKGITAVPGGKKGMLRKGLIVFQFTISLLFIIASLVIGSQLRYALQADLGFKTDAILTLNHPRGVKPVKTAILMEKVRQLPGVEKVIRELMPPINRDHARFGGGALKGREDEHVEISLYYADHEYVPFYGLKIVAGRNLLPGDSTKELLISETCARALGFSDLSKAIGREVYANPRDAYPVAGVVADFYENSFHQATAPVVIVHDPLQEGTLGVKIDAQHMTAGEISTLIARMEKEWKVLFPNIPFVCSFLDDSIANMYADDLRTERLTNVAMVITVFISCLGLLGLAIFSTGRRTKEIGIRKVLGATVAGIMVMLCKEVVLLIVLALLIASPLAWYCMHSWLQDFAYRASLNGWLFVAAGAAAIGLALLTVGFQSIKAARANPVKSLRTE